MSTRISGATLKMAPSLCAMIITAHHWLIEQEKKRLDSDNIKRPSTKWEFVSLFNVDVKVVLDRHPLLGTGPLPDWLRNLAHGRSMVTLDTYHHNLSLALYCCTLRSAC